MERIVKLAYCISLPVPAMPLQREDDVRFIFKYTPNTVSLELNWETKRQDIIKVHVATALIQTLRVFTKSMVECSLIMR